LLSKVEIDILKHLSNEGLVDQMNSRTIKHISEKIGINYYRIRTNLNHLNLLGMVKKGFKEKSSNTFYISEIGQKNIPN
jgi:NADH/NAD ratio-sensing transcriptional regulator Rex